MIEAIRSLYRYGQRLTVSPFKDILGGKKRGAYLLDIRSEGLTLNLVTDRDFSVPKEVGRSVDADSKPNHGWDSGKYVLRAQHPKKKTLIQGEAFWQQAKEDFLRAGLPKLAARIEAAEKEILESKALELENKKLMAFGREIDNKRNIILAVDGTPVTDLPQLRAYWESQYAEAGQGDTAPTHTDIITGKPCKPIKNHTKVSKVPGIGSSVPVISFKFPAFATHGRENGENFPVSVETCRSYTSGLQHVINQGYQATLGDGKQANQALLFWPETNVEHPLIPLAVQIMDNRYLTSEQANHIWAEIEACIAAEDETPISMLLIRGTKGRVSFLNYQVQSAFQLAKCLVQFKKEFQALKSNLTFRAVSSFKRDDREKIDVFHGLLLAQLAWCVVTGDPYPASLLTSLSSVPSIHEDKFPTVLTWHNAYFMRKGFPTMETVTIPEATEGVEEPIGPEEEEWVARGIPLRFLRCQTTLKRNAHTAAYRFGVGVALHGYLGAFYHRKDTGLSQADDLTRAQNNPRAFYNFSTSKSLVFTQAFKKTSSKYLRGGRAIAAMYEEAFENLGGFLTRIRLTEGDRFAITQGFNDQNAWNRAFFKWAKWEKRIPRVESPKKENEKTAKKKKHNQPVAQ